MKRLLIFLLLLFSSNIFSIESLDGFLVSAYDDRFRVVSPEKFKPLMEIVIENNSLVRLIGKLIINQKKVVGYASIEPSKFAKLSTSLKKGDILHFIPLSPAFQEVELIIGNKVYEIPPKK